MKPRFYFLFTLFTLLFLFYPGDGDYFHTFAYQRSLFVTKNETTKISTHSIPVLKIQSYPELSGEGIYIVEIASFTPLYERNARMQFLPASTTKIITALVAYDLFDAEDTVTVNRIITEGQTMGLTVGEKITVENLLYGILVHSGNDAAYALADHYGYEKFIESMNQKAKQLGMNNTRFKNPAGLDDFEQYTTPFDMTLAARELLKNKMLSKIVSTRDITVADSQFINFHRLSNVNKLLGEIHGIGGLKTGYTDNAGENLISLYKLNGRQYIITILKSRDRFADTKAVVKWLNENVEYVAP